MPEHIRALLFLLVLSAPVWWIARGAFSGLVPCSSFDRWRNVWFAVILALFLSHNYWLFAFILMVVVLVSMRQEPHIAGLYFLLLFAGSPVTTQVPGLGLINYFLVVDHYRLLAIAVLLPAALVLVQSTRSSPWGKCPTDKLVFAYFVLLSALDFRDTTITDGFRGIVTNFLQILLPYYVVSRSIRDMDGFRTAMAGFLIATLLLVPVAAFEAVRGWRLHVGLNIPLGLDPLGFADYMTRGGLLRATASLGHPIILGFVMAVAMGFLLFLSNGLTKSWHRWMAWSGLILGLLASLSRGPWVGAIMLGMLAIVFTHRPIRNLLKVAAVSVLAGMILMMLPAGRNFINLLPFVGSQDTGSIEYRANLWNFVGPVVERNFWFGSTDYLFTPELRALASIQGGGIADLVNHYYQIVLASGVIGLVLFVLILVRSLQIVWRGMRLRSMVQAERTLGISLFCTLFSVSAMIATVSALGVVPAVLWSVAGLCSAYHLMDQPLKIQSSDSGVAHAVQRR